uniref:PyrJ2 n=1 Tax=Streptomyces rugosporus TaxID=295838 RepID=K7QVV8_STRRG|nr:PyrJ2 [Streptomyces rugosporus]
MTEWQKRLATISAVLAMVLGIIDSNIVAAAAWPIAKSLDPAHGLEYLPWLVAAYAIAATVTQPLYGKLYDLYGPKRIFLFSLALFLAGSALCGAAQTMGQLIFFRGVQGLGGGGLMSVTLVVVLSLWPPKEADSSGRGGSGGAGAGMGGVMTGIGIVVGPLLGGVITDNWSWRWIFFVNLPLGLVAWALCLWGLRLPKPTGTARIDFVGAGLISGATVALLLVTQWGGREFAWDSSEILALLAAGAVLLIAFLIRQGLVRQGALGRLVAKEPIFPLTLFANKVFRVASLQQFISGMVTIGSVVYITIYLQAVQHIPATQAGLHLLPMALGMTVAAIIAGRLVAQPGMFRNVMVAGMATVALALGLMSLLKADTSFWLINLYLLVLGAGLGQVLGLALLAVQKDAPAGQLGVSITSIRFSQTLGGAVGSAVFGTILTRAYTSGLPPELASTGGEAGLNLSRMGALSEAARHQVVEALVGAIDTVFRVGLVVALVAVVVTFFLPEPRRAVQPDRTAAV